MENKSKVKKGVRIKPLPGLIKPGKWKIIESLKGDPVRCTFHKELKLQAPLDDSEDSACSRIHELSHIRHSPKKHPKKNTEAFIYVEEYRVNLLGKRKTGFPLDTPCRRMTTERLNEFFGQCKTERQFLLYFIASGEDAAIYPRLNEVNKEMSLSAIDDRYGALYPLLRKFRRSCSIQSAKKLAARIDDLYPEEEEESEEAKEARMVYAPGKTNFGKAQLLSLALEHKTLTQPARTYRFSDTGFVPRHIHRMPIDGRVFIDKLKQRGGAIMVDCSGSMHPNTKALDKIVSKAPAVNVMFYHGYEIGRYRKGFSGEIATVAKDGRRVKPELLGEFLSTGGENRIDLPALVHLARQKQTPKIWVSDTVATDDRGERCEEASRECVNYARAHGIKIIYSLNDAVKAFGG